MASEKGNKRYGSFFYSYTTTMAAHKKKGVVGRKRPSRGNAKNRFPVPIHEKKRVVLTVAKEGDSDYFPATYACCERDDYIITEAPTKENYRDYWRMVWRDGCKICVSLSEKLSASDGSLCYPYWPSKEGEKMEIEGNRFVIECKKRNDMKGYVIYDLRIASTDPSVDAVASKQIDSKQKPADQQEEDEDKKWRLDARTRMRDIQTAYQESLKK
ncbi:Protein-tyrosine phosphatase [Teladorsagia circumcincta]|uniref:Protein-tyrosine phosphatase n=1 Tax=Teladorsagia circumcincta TaxID=45464 RepID=A0A2G9UFQ2_TELCI|nr:Protein-tyrosine phosphatase [Teladorsagia circumcincta]